MRGINGAEVQDLGNSMYKPAWLDLMVQPQQGNENPTASKRPSVADFSDRLEEIEH